MHRAVLRRMVLAILHSLLETAGQKLTVATELPSKALNMLGMTWSGKHQVQDSQHPVVLLWREFSPCLVNLPCLLQDSRHPRLQRFKPTGCLNRSSKKNQHLETRLTIQQLKDAALMTLLDLSAAAPASPRAVWYAACIHKILMQTIRKPSVFMYSMIFNDSMKCFLLSYTYHLWSCILSISV